MDDRARRGDAATAHAWGAGSVDAVGVTHYGSAVLRGDREGQYRTDVAGSQGVAGIGVRSRATGPQHGRGISGVATVGIEVVFADQGLADLQHKIGRA